MTDRDIIRFEAKAYPEPNSGCWLWIGALVPDGYGSFYWGRDGRHAIKAHRAAWTLYRGALGEEDHVLHRCDNPLCVNPDHLFLGDNGANVADRVRKGRSARLVGSANHNWIDGASRLRGKVGQPRGEHMGAAKLTADLVRAIRADPRSQSRIAAAFGVSQTLVSQIKLRKIWTHVD